MPRKLEPPITPEEAIHVWFGGAKELAKQPFPFTCRCGDRTYPDKDARGKRVDKAIMGIDDCLRHVRRAHKERIKKDEKNV